MNQGKKGALPVQPLLATSPYEPEFFEVRSHDLTQKSIANGDEIACLMWVGNVGHA